MFCSFCCLFCPVVLLISGFVGSPIRQLLIHSSVLHLRQITDEPITFEEYVYFSKFSVSSFS